MPLVQTYCKRLAAVTVLMWSGTSVAYPGELGTSVAAGVTGGGELRPGPSVAASGHVGVSEALDLNLRVGLSLHTESPDSDITLLRAAPAISYKFDVIKWVPYVGAGAGFFSLFGDAGDQGVAVELFTGMNYLVSRNWSVGIRYRLDWLLSDRYRQPLHSGLLQIGYHPGW